MNGSAVGLGFGLEASGSTGACCLSGLRIGLATPNSGCVGGLNCGFSLAFCGVLWGELEAILALMLASGCRCEEEEVVLAPAKVSAGLRSETMAVAMSVRRDVTVVVRALVSRLGCKREFQVPSQINIRSLVATGSKTPRARRPGRQSICFRVSHVS